MSYSNSYFLLIIGLLIYGCASSPLPENYDGPVAIITDTHKSLGDSKANFFILDKIDGKEIEDSVDRTKEKHFNLFDAFVLGKNQGGFLMVPVSVKREVPSRELKLTLKGITHVAAPILRLRHRIFKISGDIVFKPKPNVIYVVKGVLGKEYSAVWLEDSSGKIVAEKIEKHSSSKN